MANNPPPAGWHADPSVPGQQRYWDGTRWTEQIRGAPPPQPQKRRGGTFLKVILGVVLGGTILIVGCVSLLAVGLESEQEVVPLAVELRGDGPMISERLRA